MPEGNKSVCLVSLGCSKNRVDSEIMLGALKKSGFSLTMDEREAEVLVVNTCGFIEDAKKESIDAILALAEYKKTGRCRTLVVAGCLTQRYKEELEKELPEVDFFIGVGEYPRIADILEMGAGGAKGKVYAGVPAYIHDYDTPRLVSTPGHYAYVKVAEGCGNLCSYCVIPEIRGDLRSRPVLSVVKEVEGLAEAGVKEVNLVSQDTTSYGRDLGDVRLEGLLKRLVGINGVEWIRLFYLYPARITDELIGLIRDNEKICKYIDMPVQHVNQGILRAMNRHYTRRDIEAVIGKLREEIPGVVIRTSLIVGFPGETEDEFEELLGFVKNIRFDRLGVFKYSREEATPAYGFKGQVGARVKAKRFKRLMEAQAGISLERNNGLIGRVVRVLVEERRSSADGTGEITVGRYEGQAPEVDGVTYLKGFGQPGDMIDAVVTSADEYDIIAEPVKDSSVKAI